MADFDFSKSDIELLKELLTYPNDFRYPVGTILTSPEDIDPATKYGGEWEKIEDRFLLGAGSTFENGSIGGEIEHTLTTDEMPSHIHLTGLGDFRYMVDSNNESTDWGLKFSHELAYTAESSKMENAGGSQPHNNMPPYKAMYMWIKTKTQKQKEMEGSV